MFLDGNQRIMTNSCKYKNLELDINKNINDLIDESYQIFNETLLNSEIYFKGKKVLFKTEKDLHTMKELGYEHIISMENSLGLRIYEKNRIIYVPLIEKILKNCCNKNCDNIKIYKVARHEDGFYIRYTYKSSNTVIPTEDGKYKVYSKNSFALINVLPANNLIEIRASKQIVEKLISTIANLIEDNNVRIEKVELFGLDMDKKVDIFVKKVGGKIIKSADTPIDAGEDEITNEMLEKISEILRTIDDRIYSDDGEADVNYTIDKLKHSFNGNMFSYLLLRGLGTLELKSVIKDLRDTPLYEWIRPHLSTKISSVEVPVINDKLKEKYIIRFEKQTDSVSFTKKCNENVVEKVRELLVLNS